MTTEELCAEIDELVKAATTYPAKEMELLIQAARVSPVLKSAALEVEVAMMANLQLIVEYRTLAVEAAKKLREMQARMDSELQAGLRAMKEATR